MARRKKSKYQLRKSYPYGICKVSVLPIRKRPSDSEEMVSQLLFGECVEILAKKSNWLRIRCLYDQYEGWIDSKQIDKIKEEECVRYSKQYACSIELVQSIHNDEHAFPILLGSSLPLFNGLHFEMPDTRYIFNGLVIDPRSIENPYEMVERIARKFIHAPYLWGGRSVFGIDCSGFTQVVFKLLGIQLPRDASQQVQSGEVVDFLESAQVGDLAFFENEDRRITHVGILLPEGKIIHASGQVRVDSIDHQGIFNADIQKYTHTFRVAKRYMPKQLIHVPATETSDAK